MARMPAYTVQQKEILRLIAEHGQVKFGLGRGTGVGLTKALGTPMILCKSEQEQVLRSRRLIERQANGNFVLTQFGREEVERLGVTANA